MRSGARFASPDRLSPANGPLTGIEPRPVAKFLGARDAPDGEIRCKTRRERAADSLIAQSVRGISRRACQYFFRLEPEQTARHVQREQE